jgi:hypothetical protein
MLEHDAMLLRAAWQLRLRLSSGHVAIKITRARRSRSAFTCGTAT